MNPLTVFNSSSIAYFLNSQNIKIKNSRDNKTSEMQNSRTLLKTTKAKNINSSLTKTTQQQDNLHFQINLQYPKQTQIFAVRLQTS